MDPTVNMYQHRPQQDTPSHDVISQSKPSGLENYCKDLLQSLNTNMAGLIAHAGPRENENTNPNSQIMKVVDPVTGKIRLENKMIGNNFETQSIKSDVTYKWSAIGEMNDQELDQLKAKNEARMA